MGTEQSVISAGSSSSSSPYETDFRFSSNDTITFTWNGASASGDRFQSSMLFRDPSAWYHVVLRLDMNNAARSERCKVYVNGTQIQMNAIGTSAGNADGAWNANGYPHAIGNSSWG
jgi:hypothetical protein